MVMLELYYMQYQDKPCVYLTSLWLLLPGHIGIAVPDVHAACKLFEEQGVTFVKKPDDGKLEWINDIFVICVFNLSFLMSVYHTLNYDKDTDWKSELPEMFSIWIFFLASILNLFAGFPLPSLLSQVKWKAWPSFRTLMATGLRFWVLTTWCPLPHKNNVLPAAVHTGPTCRVLTERTDHWSLAKNLATRWQAEEKWSRITCLMANSIPWCGRH